MQMLLNESGRQADQERSLFKLFHVSDLHFGVHLREALVSGMPGWEIHDPKVVSRLAESIRRQGRECNEQTIPYRVICSGDLSTWGTLGALQTAQDFLSDKRISRRIGGPASLPDEDSPYVPGNHDTWDGWFPPLRQLSPFHIARTDLPSYSLLYESAAPGSTRRAKERPYPFRLPLYADEQIVLRLYGLDSTRVDLIPSQELSVLRASIEEITQRTSLRSEQVQWLRDRFKGFTDDDLRRAVAAIALGFMDEHQLYDLAAFVKEEEEEFKQDKRRLIRLAMTHHPLAYPKTPRTMPDWTPDPIRALHGMGIVQAVLQALGFFGVLCGHQHQGFVKTICPNPILPPLHVFSVGTSGQEVELTQTERGLLRLDWDEVLPEEREAYRTSVTKLNQYMTYEIVHTSEKHLWRTKAWRFLPHRSLFSPDLWSIESELPSIL
jgi:3',5'-cyclic AMP phosphodiesterase CpdA